MSESAAAPRIGVVVVGTGMIANLHLAALRASRRAEVVRLVDVNPARAAAASLANGGAPWTTDLQEAIGDPGCQAVVVCTPNSTHASIARACLDAGRHVLMEKPMATTVADAMELSAGFRERGLSLAAAHTHRAYDYSRTVKQSIDEGTVGVPRLIRMSLLGGWIWGDWRAWVTRPELSGGHPLHNGVHLLDTVTWWMGRRPVAVRARGARPTSAALRIDDYLEMVVTYADGGVAVCEMSRGHRPGGIAQRDLLVVGDSGLLTMRDGADATPVLTESGVSAIAAQGSDAFARQLDAWLDSMSGGAPLATSVDGALAVAMAVAADESIRSGETVPLDRVGPEALVGAGR